MVEFSFEEPIFILLKDFQWKKKSSFRFYYTPFESSQINPNSSLFENNDYKINIICGPVNENDIANIKLNHYFEFHNYTRKEYFEDYGKQTPNYILEISINEEYVGRNRYYYARSDCKHQAEQYLIGCNFNRKDSRDKWEKLIESLYLEFRYKKNGLMDQLHIRFTELMIESFKDIVRFLWKIYTNNEKEKFLPSFLHLLREFDKKKLKLKDFSNLNLRKEFESIVYKCIISEGILPLYIDLNTMGSKFIRWCNIFCCNYLSCGMCLNEEILPWSTQFHASFIVIDRHYSYTEKNRVHQKLLNDRFYLQDSSYYRIKLLDFFPLDQWITLISDFLLKKFDEFIQILADEKNEISKIYEQNSELNKKPQPMKSYQCQETGVRAAFLEKADKESRTITTKALKENYQKFKNEKKDIKQPIFRVLIEAFNQLDDGGIILPKLLAESFISTYFSELEETKILQNVCNLIAETEMRTYSLFELNCQTVVGDFVQNIYQSMKNYIEILLPSNINENFENDKNYKNYFTKFASEIVNKEFVAPCYLDTRLDYFGIYADEFLKEKIDKLISGPNIDCENDAKITEVQKEFFKNYSASFVKFKIKSKNSINENSLFGQKSIRDKNCILNFQEEEKSSANKSEINLYNSSINHVGDNENEILNKKEEEKNKEDFIKDNDKKMSKMHEIKEIVNNAEQKNLRFSNCLSSLIFRVRLNLIELRKQIIGYKYKKWKNKDISHLKKLNKKKYENRELLREFSYYYYNSVRLQQMKNEKKGILSYIGDVIIKDPGAQIDFIDTMSNNFN